VDEIKKLYDGAAAANFRKRLSELLPKVTGTLEPGDAVHGLGRRKHFERD